MKILGIIPSRYASTRFPGKPLAMIAGKSMIQRVYEQASKSPSLTKVIVATDDSRIFENVQSFNGNVVMTSENHLNGTSRCWEALEQNGESYEVIVNIQGDEPFIDPEQIDQVAKLFESNDIEIGTLVKKIQSKEELFNPNVVKAVFDRQKKAMYFSRQAIPFLRDKQPGEYIANHDFYKHIGIYGYRFDILKKIVKLKPAVMELAENLEQLRWLENGFKINVQITNKEAVSIDTPEDLLKLTNSA